MRIEDGIAWTKTAAVYKDGILEGTGTMVPGLNQNYLQSECILRGGTATVPGTLSFGGQVTLPTNIVLEVGLTSDAHGQVHVGGKLTFRKDLNTVIRIRVSDVDKTAAIRPSDTFVVLDYGGSLENYKAERISFVVENASPKRLDTSAAQLTFDTTAKTLSITGVKSANKGLAVFIR